MARLAQMGQDAEVTIGLVDPANPTTVTPITELANLEIKTMDLAGPTREEVDVTSYKSGAYLEFELAARGDLQNATMDINFDTAAYDKIVELAASNDLLEVEITFPKAISTSTAEATLTFRGYIQGIPLSLPATGGIEASIDFRITGLYTFSAEA